MNNASTIMNNNDSQNMLSNVPHTGACYGKMATRCVLCVGMSLLLSPLLPAIGLVYLARYVHNIYM